MRLSDTRKLHLERPGIHVIVWVYVQSPSQIVFKSVYFSYRYVDIVELNLRNINQMKVMTLQFNLAGDSGMTVT